jgi:hypothetical protein
MERLVIIARAPCRKITELRQDNQKQHQFGLIYRCGFATLYRSGLLNEQDLRSVST